MIWITETTTLFRGRWIWEGWGSRLITSIFRSDALACILCAAAIPPPLSDTVCKSIVASEIPRPDPPSSSGRAMPIHPPFARSRCKSWGYSPVSSRFAQYSWCVQWEVTAVRTGMILHQDILSKFWQWLPEPPVVCLKIHLFPSAYWLLERSKLWMLSWQPHFDSVLCQPI